jgi:hypothetical protein
MCCLCATASIWCTTQDYKMMEEANDDGVLRQLLGLE